MLVCDFCVELTYMPVVVISLSVHMSILPLSFVVLLGDPLENGVPYAMGPLSVLSVCPDCLCVCNIGVLWPHGWMDQDATLYGGRP